MSTDRAGEAIYRKGRQPGYLGEVLNKRRAESIDSPDAADRNKGSPDSRRPKRHDRCVAQVFLRVILRGRVGSSGGVVGQHSGIVTLAHDTRGSPRHPGGGKKKDRN